MELKKKRSAYFYRNIMNYITCLLGLLCFLIIVTQDKITTYNLFNIGFWMIFIFCAVIDNLIQRDIDLNDTFIVYTFGSLVFRIVCIFGLYKYWFCDEEDITGTIRYGFITLSSFLIFIIIGLLQSQKQKNKGLQDATVGQAGSEKSMDSAL